MEVRQNGHRGSTVWWWMETRLVVITLSCRQVCTWNLQNESGLEVKLEQKYCTFGTTVTGLLTRSITCRGLHVPCSSTTCRHCACMCSHSSLWASVSPEKVVQSSPSPPQHPHLSGPWLKSRWLCLLNLSSPLMLPTPAIAQICSSLALTFLFLKNIYLILYFGCTGSLLLCGGFV